MPSCADDYDELDEYAFDDDEDDAAEDPDYNPCPDGLGLPSDYDANERDNHNLQTLASFERTIRIGLAFDQLDAVRLAVKHRAAHVEHKRKKTRGRKANTIAQVEIDKATLRMRVLADRYNSNFARIQALHPRDYDPATDASAAARLRAINTTTDLAVPNVAAARSLNDSQRSGSWLWKPTNDHFKLVDVVQWFRAKAEKDRANEAVNRLCAEFRRTTLGYRAYSQLWRASAVTRVGGERAYALKIAVMWEQMAKRCENEYDRARRPGVPADRLDQTDVRRI
ncbi:hypothetical protein C2E23DRAFT_730646 [Lenzites betulinus]|nr:hypothetical protein C2E23DRAFT_730646 [Lenzites betulinus]